ncbi:RNA polymerase sigma factor [Marinoscillum sp. MHG1-6]|uniref:RNA polymerase sigma factor n=1 Tax=Marinoscillum sp. MHG1-6 TaxID=2959627 RepID=UPI0021574B2F|nr:RNA polymerase sigma factor [Marinoscillum sp. MHG1-6]
MKEKEERINETVNSQRVRLLNFIRQFVSHDEDAEDILQDVLYQFVSGYEQIRSWDQVTSWLFRVARNKITDSYRKKKPETFSSLILSDDQEFLSLEDILPDLNSLPDSELHGEMIWERIEEMLDMMPEKQRQVFIWHEFEQKSFKEIASFTGEPENTLMSRKRYAILALRDGLVDMYKEMFN